MTAILDLIPLFAFFYFAKTYGVLAGAGALLVATLAVYVVHFIKQKGKLNKQQWVTLILTIVFCGLSLAFMTKPLSNGNRWLSTVFLPSPYSSA